MTQPILGYFVGVGGAVRVLAQAHPEAAEWWKVNSFHYQRRGGHPIFPVDCCELCPGDGMTREAAKPN